MDMAQWSVETWLGVIGAFATFCGGVWWCSAAYSQLRAIRVQVEKINGRVGRHDSAIAEFDKKFVRIETHLELES